MHTKDFRVKEFIFLLISHDCDHQIRSYIRSLGNEKSPSELKKEQKCSELPNTNIMVSYNRYFYESNIFNYSMQDGPSECVVATSLGVNTTDIRGKKYYRHAAHRSLNQLFYS
uniref:Uncharacterized protein n=1 Tax=Glossina austeni TaxID=7395 RepID=A0A1A9VD63_GLOAU